MPLPNHGEPEVNPRSHPLCDRNTDVPIKKRRFMLETCSSSLPHSDCSSPVTCGVSRKSSDLESLVSDTCNPPASASALTGNGSCEPSSESIGSRELNITPASEGYSLPDHEELQPNMTSKETSNRKELPPFKMLSSSPVTGNFQPQSAKEPLKLPIKDANMEDKALRDTSAFSVVSGNSEHQFALEQHVPLPKDIINSGGRYLKQEKLDLRSWNLPLTEIRENLQSKSIDAEPKADSAQLDRLNWDLNTTMDTWQESFDSSLNDEISGRGRSDVVVGFAPAEFLCKEAVGTGTASRKCVLDENNHHLQMPSNPSKTADEESHSEACLDLQLKPSLMAESLFQWGYATPLVKPDSMSEVPLLSLAVNPSLASCIPTSAACRSLKAEAPGDCGKKDSGQTNADFPRLVGLKQVKSEPCEGHETSNIRGPCNLKSTLGAVKSEPSEDQYGGLSRHLGACRTTPNTMKTIFGFGVPFEKTVQSSLIRNLSMQQNCLNVPNVVTPCETLDEAPILVSNDPSAHTTDNHDPKPHTDDTQDPKPHTGDTQDPKPHTGDTQDPKPHTGDTQDLKPHSTETEDCAQLPVGTKIHQHGSLNPSDIIQQPIVTEDESLRLLEQACETASLSSESLSESLLPGIEEEIVSDVNSNVAQMFCGDGYTLSKVTSTDEAHTDSYEKTKLAESSVGEFELSAEGPDKPCKTNGVSINDSNTDVAAITVQKQRDDDEIEDGEVRDLALRSRVEDPFAKKEGNQVNIVDLFCTVNVPLALPPHKDLTDGNMESSDGLNISGSVNSSDNQHNDTNVLRNTSELSLAPEPSVDANTNTNSDKRKLGKAICKIPSNYLKDKAREWNLKSDRLGAGTVTEEIHDKASNIQERASKGSDPLLAKFSVSSKTELFIRESARRRAKDKGVHSRFVNLNSVTDRLTYDMVKSNPGRTISLRTKKERLIEKPLRSEKSHPRRIRDEKNKYRPRIFEHERSKDQTAERRGSDPLHIRSRDNDNIKFLRDDRDFVREHAIEQVDCSTGSRFPRAINTSEVARASASCRLTRKLVDNELDNLSHTSFRRRRSPREGVQVSVGMQMGHQPNSVVNPPNYTGRDVQDVSDFVVRDREERRLRTLPDGRIAPPLFAYTRYARGESSLIRRDESILARRERSLSPIQRRAPLHFPPNCSGSSPRDESRSYHQWSPARRSPDGFDGPRELVNCRSPRAIRSNRMRSPPRRPCFADDTVGRRRGSPPFAIDMGPSRDGDFQRPDRGLQRSIRRYDRENSGEHFGSFPHNQFGEPSGDVECVDRSCSERRERLVLSRSFRQRRSVTDDDNESFPSHPDGGSAGPFRFCPEGNQGFPERGCPRDFDGHVRKRLGNRLRGTLMEQEEDYRYNDDPGWQDADSSDVRLKRRRLQRQRQRQQ